MISTVIIISSSDPSISTHTVRDQVVFVFVFTFWCSFLSCNMHTNCGNTPPSFLSFHCIILNNKTTRILIRIASWALVTNSRSIRGRQGGRRKRHPPLHDWWEGKSKGYTHNTCIVTQRHAHEPTSQPTRERPFNVSVWARQSTETHNIRDRLNSISKLNTSSVAVVVSVGTDRSL